MIRKTARSLFAALLLSTAFQPSFAWAETIEDAVRAAVTSHPQVEQARAKIDAADQKRKSEFSAFFPQVSLGAQAGRIFGNNSTSRGSQVTRDSAYSYFGEVNATARQPLFDGFEARNRVDAAQADKKSAAMTLVDVREQLAFRAAQAYLDVAQARTIYAMLRAQEKKGQDYLNRITLQVEQGASDEAEKQQALDVLVVLKGLVLDYEGLLRSAETRFSELTGRSPDQNMVAPVFDNALIPETADEAVADAIQTHPAIQAAKLSAKSAEYKVGAEKAALFPDVSGELSYLESDRREEIGGELTDARALLRMNWNFETGGGQRARILQKRNEHIEQVARTQGIRRQIERDIRIAYSERDVAERRMKNKAERYRLNKELFDTYEVQFEGARVRILQLMQADNQLFNTELEKVAAQYRLMVSKYAVLAGMGQLQANILQTAGQP